MKQKLLYVCIAIAILIPLLIASRQVLTGNINFWYDPARDFLLAYDNLHKLTLIGPTTGIPGIFYGPYWVWLLSFGLLFSLDPKIVIFIVITLPYFTLFPFILFKFRKTFGWATCIILWTLFIFGPGLHYVINPWNPHPALLLTLLLIYSLTYLDFKNYTKKYLFYHIAIGFLTGIIVNFHVSFGLGVVAGVFLFLVIRVFRLKRTIKQRLIILSSYLLGIFISFLPFLIFEIRHGFQQIKTAISVFTAEASVVSVKGLSDQEILRELFEVLASLVKLPLFYAITLFVVATLYYVYQYRKKQIHIYKEEKKLMVLLLCIVSTLMFLYLSSKNPVWSYHFIGVEIIFLLAIGLVISKSIFLRSIFGVIALYVAFSTSFSLFNDSKISPLTNSSLVTKEYIVRIIHEDAKDDNYTVHMYSPSIYTYDYSYLLQWIADKDIPYDPGMHTEKADLVYLIIPSSVGNEQDFINSRTANDQFETVKVWKIPNGTKIIKRMKQR